MSFKTNPCEELSIVKKPQTLFQRKQNLSAAIKKIAITIAEPRATYLIKSTDYNPTNPALSFNCRSGFRLLS